MTVELKTLIFIAFELIWCLYYWITAIYRTTELKTCLLYLLCILWLQSSCSSLITSFFGYTEKYLALGACHVCPILTVCVSASLCMPSVCHLWHVPASILKHCWLVLKSTFSLLAHTLFFFSTLFIHTVVKVGLFSSSSARCRLNSREFLSQVFSGLCSQSERSLMSRCVTHVVLDGL